MLAKAEDEAEDDDGYGDGDDSYLSIEINQAIITELEMVLNVMNGRRAMKNSRYPHER